MKLNYEIYRRKVRACFVGKSVGGTLGMPYEGPVQVNNVTYYDPVPNEMVPNDDLGNTYARGSSCQQAEIRGSVEFI